MESGKGGMFCSTGAGGCCGGGLNDVDVDFGGDAFAVDPWMAVDELMLVSLSNEFCMCVSGWMSCVGDDGGDKRPALECCKCCDGEGGGEIGGFGLLLLLRDGETETRVEAIGGVVEWKLGCIWNKGKYKLVEKHARK